VTDLRIDDARPSDDAALRALLRVPVPGEVALSFEREPSYFGAGTGLDERCETLVARAGDAVVAVASAAVRQLHLQGTPVRCGYLSQLRVAPGYEGRGLVARGLRTVRDRLMAQGVPGAYATVSLGNRAAEALLLRRLGRGAEGFAPVTVLHTLTYAATRADGVRRRVDVAPAACAADVAEAESFLRQHGPRRQLFPEVRPGSLLGGRPGLRIGDVLLARSAGSLRGVVAVWDASSVRQTIVRGYGPRLRRWRPWLDLARRLRGALPLPDVGAPLRVASAGWLTVADDDPSVASALLAAAVRAAAAGGAHALAVGLTEEDPLLPVARRRPHVGYRSRLLALPLADPGFVARLAGIRFVDVGTL